MKYTWKITLILVLISSSVLQAQIPRIINYQGKLTDTVGVGMNGDYDITFRLFDTESGGTAFWEEIHGGSEVVTVTKGLFDVQLGAITPIGPAIAFDDTYWVELEIETEVLSPRLLLTAVPYAFRAMIAETALVVIGSDNDWTVDRASGSKVYTFSTDDSVGIGTSTPLERLDLEGAIRIGNTVNNNAGTIRWTGTDFEGYTGSEWKSLTSGGGASQWEEDIGGEFIYPTGYTGVRIYKSGPNAGKIDVLQSDPVVQIDDKQYATWMLESVGLNTDVVGEAQLKNGIFEVDLAEQSEASDLWLFYHIVAENTIIPFVTAQDKAILAARVEGSVFIVDAIQGDGSARFSYRLTGRRIDKASLLPNEINRRQLKYYNEHYIDVDRYDRNGEEK